MSVRATERLIGDLVIVTGLADSPHMVVKAVSEETKIITTVWFTDCKKYQEGFFPASALDRTEPKKKPPIKSARKSVNKAKVARRSAN